MQGGPDITHHWGPDAPTPEEIAGALVKGEDVLFIAHFGEKLVALIARAVWFQAPRKESKPVGWTEVPLSGGRAEKSKPAVVMIPNFSGIGMLSLFSCYLRDWADILPEHLDPRYVSEDPDRVDQDGNYSNRELPDSVALDDGDADDINSGTGSVARELEARNDAKGRPNTVHVYYGSD